MNDMLIQEINDDVRRERMHAIWNAVKKPLLIAASLLIAVTAGVSITKHYDQQAKAEATTLLLNASEQYARKDYKAAESGFAKTAEAAGSGELAGIAKLWQARSLIAAGDTPKAAGLLTTLATSGDANALRIRDMACIHLYGLNADVPADCNGNAVSPMRASLALLDAATLWQAGKIEEAASALKKLASDESLAEEERDLAKRYLTTITAGEQAHAR